METKEEHMPEEFYYVRKRKWWKRPGPWVTIGVIIVLGGGGLGYWRMHHSHRTTPAFTVRWVPVTSGNVSESVSFSGSLEPVNQATVTGNGQLLSVSVKVGDKVKKGQVIAQLDTSSLGLQLEQAKAALSEAEAKLAQDKEPVITTSYTGSNGGRGGQGQPQTTSTSPDPNVIAQAQASVNSAQAQVTSLEQQIADCSVKSPIAGTVVQVADPNQTSQSSTTSSGQQSSGGSAIAIITNLSSSDFEVQANVAESDITSIHKGQKATISLSSNGGPVVTGTVESVGLLPQTQSGVTTYPVVVKVNKPSNSSITLLPGAAVTIDVTEQQAINVLTVPTAAITQRGGQTGVYVESSSSSGQGSASTNTAGGFPGMQGAAHALAGLQFQPISVGVYGGNTVEVKSGLTSGEEVAIVVPNASSSTGTSTTTSSGGFGFGALAGGGGFGGGGFTRGGGAGGSYARGSGGFSGGGTYGGGFSGGGANG